MFAYNVRGYNFLLQGINKFLKPWVKCKCCQCQWSVALISKVLGLGDGKGCYSGIWNHELWNKLRLIKYCVLVNGNGRISNDGIPGGFKLFQWSLKPPKKVVVMQCTSHIFSYPFCMWLMPNRPSCPFLFLGYNIFILLIINIKNEQRESVESVVESFFK